MKKVMKAAIAAGAAGALLLGGAGTFALWNATGDLDDAGTVTTGHLTMVNGTGAWQDISVPLAPVVFDATTETIVPGDTVRYSQNVTISAEGKNLAGELVVGNTAVVIPADLAGQVTVAVAPTAVAGTSVAGTTVTFSEPGTYIVPVTITVAFAKGNLTDAITPAATMSKAIDLPALSLTLNQTRS
ncbi:alternate signal-mediated exported protein, RER_14450 family [Arthrobacter alpinus]|uniref:Alternate signal-mediated exported protein, RER_14450 family n=1 Tax=Arthrobacter alpinus TaxID=656366 RepID=A0A1H5KEZ8_9MICC|nr:alternate-type signal peptide domain-containing protein [Arthrobacter alpinus]SEE63416.1 alternate signal-mediated exported protein, RER_14450 family [Arthrobacter alpinus]